ncbi:MAG TPA: MerR family transcriptional regulator [Thermoanaerobaculia bacterium]|nr:MerR family transcriptional regulator [Thermoanaerobaculia bacterium]
MRSLPWRVGELARQTGLSVRTLHYYDEIGLLRPSRHTAAGHRLYEAADIARLQQIKSLRFLGLSLDEIRDTLRSPGMPQRRVIELHIARLKEQIALQQKLCWRLELIAAQLDSAAGIAVDELTRTIEEITMFEKYYTPEQLQEIKERGRQVGEERIRQVEGEWQELIAAVHREMEKGTDPASERVQLLARRWMSLVGEFTGGNPDVAKALGAMYQQEPALRERTGIDRAMFDYVSRAMKPLPPGPG